VLQNKKFEFCEPKLPHGKNEAEDLSPCYLEQAGSYDSEVLPMILCLRFPSFSFKLCI
jgi:hypothetical protein